MPTVLQKYKLEAYRASQYLDLCIRAGRPPPLHAREVFQEDKRHSVLWT